jgi:methyltransferase (TIGR00027 family)
VPSAGAYGKPLEPHPDVSRSRMAHKTKRACGQAVGAAGAFEQPHRAQHRAPRRDRTSHPEPGMPAERGQVVGMQVHRFVLAFDQPLADLGQVGRGEHFRRNASHQHGAIFLHGADCIGANAPVLGGVHTKRRIDDGVIRMNVGNTATSEMGESETGPGHTATLAAVGRAIHAESERPLVADHLALGLAGEPGATLMAQLKSQLPEASRQSFGLAFAIRTRFVEDAVEAAIQDGIRQYVILGAGLDSFAYRRTELTERLKIFEVDQATSQAWKRSRLEALGIAIPPSVAFVPLDAETDELRAGLIKARFDPSAPAIVSAIALTQYLGRPAIERILELVASFAPGSRLVVTYVVPAAELSEMAAAGLAWTMSQAEERGEPFVSLFRAVEFDELMTRKGFSRVEEAGPAELRKMYLADRPDAQLTGIERLATGWV